MSQDHGRHRDIRKYIITNLPKETEFFSSHEGMGEIFFYRIIDGKRVDLAEPDILISKGNHTLIVEVERANRPKHLLGVAFAISGSEIGCNGTEHFKVGKRSLLIVIDSNDVCKRGSRKPQQIKAITAMINESLDFEYAKVVTEKNVIQEVQNWISAYD